MKEETKKIFSASKENIAKEMTVIIRRYVPEKHYRIFLFGSQASGRAHERSDIDIGIEGPTPVPPAVMLNIKEEAENLPTLYKVEIVDFKNVDTKFRKVAFENVKPL